MIHVVTSGNQHLYGRQLDQMFRMRHAFYIEGHGWAGLISQNGQEVDEFDDGDVVYLMSLDAAGDVAASVRLNPTTGPTLLGKFADHSDEALPRRADCWDISRWIAQQKHRRSDNPKWPSNHQRELIVGMLEFCLSRQVTEMTMLSELRLAERMKTYGWPVRYLGEPRRYEGDKGVAVAASISVGPHLLALTRQKTGVFESVLFEVDPDRMPPPTRVMITAPEQLKALVDRIGASDARDLARILVEALDGLETPHRVEMLSAFGRLIDSASIAAQAATAFESAAQAARPS